VTYSERAKQYAIDIINGDRIACKWIILVCKEHLNGLASESDEDYPFKFVDVKADNKAKFIEMFPHTKGKWAAKKEPFLLEDWQCFFICVMFGWVKKKNDLRRYRKVLLFVPRKNGKSDLAARIGLAMFAADKEYGAEVYSGATSEKQAFEVFRPARLMALRTPDFIETGVEVNKGNINVLKNGSRFEPMIGDPGDGSSPSLAIVDEYHEHKTDAMFNTMETGMGAREQPIMLVITTAGDNMAGPCYALQKEAERVLDGSQNNDELLAMIFTVDEGDNWQSDDALKKANPNYGVSVNAEFLNSRLRDALNNARKQSTYKTKHLNVWVGAKNAYYNIQRWKDCTDESLRLEDFEGERCFIGLDLATKIDISAVEIIFPIGEHKYVRFGKYYLPHDTVMQKENEHYQGWMTDGWLTVTDGNVTDFEEIKDDIIELSEKFSVAEVAYDPAYATMLVNALVRDGIECIEVRPTVPNFTEPMKELDALSRSGGISHNGDPVMSWMMSNVIAKEDKKDGVYPNKERAENKIDGVVAHLMALNRCMAYECDADSIYTDRGIISF